MAWQRGLYVLASTLMVAAALSSWFFVGEARAGRAGSAHALMGLVWVGLGLAAAAGCLALSLAGRREMYRRDQVIAADTSTAHDWVWESDEQDRITYTNAAVTDLLGYQPAELIGVSSFDLLFDDATRTAARLVHEPSLRIGSGWDDIELDWRHLDGSRVTLQGSAAPIRDRRGQVVGIRGTRRQIAHDRHRREHLVAARERVANVLAAHEIDVALQPIVDLTSGTVAGVEALARFRDERSPEVWFGEAQDVGQTRELDELTFNLALSTLDTVPATVYLSVNASPVLLMHRAFREHLVESGIPLDRLTIEITEHARVADYSALNAALSPLRERGVRFAIDDTGAGYASLTHVLQLSPDIIKLDRALIANVEGDGARRSLVTALVLLALDVGASVTGEGVETAGQLETLSTLGVDQAQGYVLARPTTDRTDWTSWWTRDWATTFPRQPTPATDGRSR